ncbi:MAG: PEP-CTERM sorting domain-containing protein [Planctomycetota bacterium]|jgi:hypothetical protein
MGDRNFTIWVLALLFFCLAVPYAYSELIFDDGLTHIIDYTIGEEVGDIWIRDSATGQPTTINIVTGGEIYCHVNLEDHTVVNVMGGSVYQDLYGGWDDTYINVFDGYVNLLIQNEGHAVNIYGGVVDNLDVGIGLSNFNMSGGTINMIEYPISGSAGSREITISGGEILGEIYLMDGISANMTGGSISYANIHYNCFLSISGGSFDGLDVLTSTLTLIGNDFAIDGLSVPYGEYTGYYSDALITGTLASGETINNLFNLELSTLILTPIPEPATVGLLSLGALLIRKRRYI